MPFPPTLQDLYPHYTPQQLQAAEENLLAYLAVVMRIYEGIQADPAKYAEFLRLTNQNPSFKVQGAKSLPSLTSAKP
ncbi:MAG: hypothetical protein PHX83_12960 [Acidobacteriia bacterium]|nr:hypothetical protein [Terriglobia bacterium]